MRNYFLSVLIVIFFIPGFNDLHASDPDSICQVHYLNIGQGSATLLEFPCGAIMIDAGGQNNNYVDSMLMYLDEFFDGRPDLNNTLESIMITHDDMDHRLGLQDIMERYTVKRVFHNGEVGDNGDLRWAIDNPDEHDAELFEITFEDITAGGNAAGLTNDDIDPVNCDVVDPVITLLSGGFETDPGWGKTAYGKGNNHSLVVRIDFGEASFLFTGDLEIKGIETVIGYYKAQGTDSLLDVDVYNVGHHGSANATTDDLCKAMSPEIAVISVGQWDHGKESGTTMSTYYYGHPRRDVVNMILDEMPDNRRYETIRPKLASKSKKFRRKRIKNKIYATAWDGNIRVKAEADGSFTVYVNR